MKITIEVDAGFISKLVKGAALVGLLVAVTFPNGAEGGQVTVPNTFVSGGIVKASQFNDNFTTLEFGVNDNDTRIGDLTTLTTTNQSSLVAAINEVHGSLTFFGGNSSSNLIQAGGSGNLLFVQFNAGESDRVPAAFIAGRPFEMQVHLIAGYDGALNPVVPVAGGQWVIDLTWAFQNDASGFVTVTQPAVALVPITAGVLNQTSFTIQGTVPALPNTPTGVQVGHLAELEFSSNAATTADTTGSMTELNALVTVY